MVEVTTLLKLVIFSLVIGTGFVTAYSFAILGITRWRDLQQQNRNPIFYGLLVVISLTLAFAILLFGILELIK